MEPQTIRLKLGGQRIGEGLLIVNHLDQSLWWGTQKHWAADTSYIVHFFSAGAKFRCAFSSHHKLYNYIELKPISWAKPAHFDFSSSKFFSAESHIEHGWRIRDAVRPPTKAPGWVNTMCRVMPQEQGIKCMPEAELRGAYFEDAFKDVSLNIKIGQNFFFFKKPFRWYLLGITKKKIERWAKSGMSTLLK